MFHTQLLTPVQIKAMLCPLLSAKGAQRNLAVKSGISGMTLRRIATTGKVDSYVTALALERATDGEIKADALAGPSTKGYSFYQKEPARALLNLAFDEGITLARLLARHGLTGTDLWVSLNSPGGTNERTKEKVREMLRSYGLSDRLEGAQ